MSVKIPLVLVDGLPAQLQAGDTINVPASTYNARSFTNGESSAPLVIGSPVYISAADTAKLAKANAMATSGAVGLWQDVSTSAGSSGVCAVGGTVVATTGQWDAVTGGTGGLTPGSLYFIDPTTAGHLTTTAPSTVGQVVTVVGRASSTTEMELLIGTPILL